MCGIFVLAQPQGQIVDAHEIRRACSLMQHRGPDQSGYALLNKRTVGFGHNRLSIQSPTTPPQPLVDPNTGTTIVFNGEVYDYDEIGHNLSEKHEMVLTESTDTAVILALYLLHGPTPEFFSRLNGEFAFVIWDAQRRKLVAARDRFGVKPLFWYYDSSRLVFASEIKAILSVGGVERKFSTEWLDSISVLFPHRNHVNFAEGVFSVTPGEYLTMDLGAQWDPPKYQSYWSILPLLRAPSTSMTYEEAKAEVRRLLTAAVKRRLVADREMCVYLSGGVDSTIICGIASSLGHPLTSITIGFGDHPLSEEDAAAKTAQHYSLQHERVNFTSEDAARLAIKTIYHTETPLVNPHSVAGLRLSEFAHEKGFVVALTGEGSDELHLGYSLFCLDILLEMRSHREEPAKKSERLVKDLVKGTKGTALLLGALPKDNPRVRGTPCWHAGHVFHYCMAVDGLRAPHQDGHSLPNGSIDQYTPVEADGLLCLRLSHYWLGELQKYTIPCLGDRVEMASSIEGRTPLLDPTFADFMLRLPTDYLVGLETLREKRILYEAFEDMLPPHIFARTKQPVSAPPWCDVLFNTDAGQELREKYLSRKGLERADIWCPDHVDNMIAELREGADHLDSFLGVILSTQILHDLFIENPCTGDPEFSMVDKTPDVTGL